MNRTLAAHQPDLLPQISFFHKLAYSDIFVLLDSAQMPQSRSSYASRTRIKTAKGEKWLSIPVNKGTRRSYLMASMPPENGWARRMLDTIRLAYEDAPYWDYTDFTDNFQRALLGSRNLAGFNTWLISWAVECLDLDSIIVMQSATGIRMSEERLPIALCKSYGCDTYLSGQETKIYNASVIFKEARVKLRYDEFECPEYSQLWADEFVPNLSILDLIFNIGPKAGEMLYGS